MCALVGFRCGMWCGFEPSQGMCANKTDEILCFINFDLRELCAKRTKCRGQAFFFSLVAWLGVWVCKCWSDSIGCGAGMSLPRRTGILHFMSIYLMQVYMHRRNVCIIPTVEEARFYMYIKWLEMTGLWHVSAPYKLCYVVACNFLYRLLWRAIKTNNIGMPCMDGLTPI